MPPRTPSVNEQVNRSPKRRAHPRARGTAGVSPAVPLSAPTVQKPPARLLRTALSRIYHKHLSQHHLPLIPNLPIHYHPHALCIHSASTPRPPRVHSFPLALTNQPLRITPPSIPHLVTVSPLHLVRPPVRPHFCYNARFVSLSQRCPMTLPIVAIVGRPNVGKSSLLNFLASRLISIVDPTAGVTRDRISTPILFDDNRAFELTDTGGYGIVDKDNLTADIERQIQLAIEEAQLILFVVDAQSAVPVPLDVTVAEYLRKQNKPVLLVANKADGAKIANHLGEFYSLGFGDIIPVSTTNRIGKDKLLAEIEKRLDFTGGSQAPEDPTLKIAVVGKRNAGKSTLINTIAGAPRVIVSDVPGTTRDSVDVRFERDGKSFLIIDTAGVRKKAKITRDDLEFYAFHRAQRSIRRADVVFMMIDSTVDMGDVDQKLASYIASEFKPCIIVINKWDLVGEKASSEQYEKYISTKLPLLDYAPITFMSAQQNVNIAETIRLAETMHTQAATRVPTGQLNQAVEEILALRGPSSPTQQKVKVYYATQIDVKPPTLVLFVNNPDLITQEYRRFFIRQLRQRLPLSEVPVKLYVRGHHRSFEEAEERTRTGKPGLSGQAGAGGRNAKSKKKEKIRSKKASRASKRAATKAGRKR